MNTVYTKSLFLLTISFIFSLKSLPAQPSGMKNISLKEGQTYINESKVELIASSPQQLLFNVDISGISVADVETNQQTYHRIYLNGFSEFDETGKPAVPVSGRFIAVPQDAIVKVKITDAKYKEFNGINVRPAPPPQPENKELIIESFIIDENIYNADQFYPANPAWVEEEKIIRNQPITVLRFAPIQFNPVQKKIKVITECTIVVEFEGGSDYSIDRRYYSPVFHNLFNRLVVNAEHISTKNNTSAAANENFYPGCDYLIITHNNFSAAADSLALWRRFCGMKTKTAYIENIGNTTDQVKNYIQAAYDTWDPAPLFVLILGDAEFITTNYVTDHPSSDNGRIGTDLYYATVDGYDFFPDLFIGRIPVDLGIEAMAFVNKVIQYEKDPLFDPGFYDNAQVAAYFQDDNGDGYEDRRFVLTSEEIRDFLMTEGYAINRIYYANPSVNPTNYNNGSYANGEPLPPELLRSNGFQWNGNAADISGVIENGTFLVSHRDHGSRNGWGDPYYRSSNVRALTNGSKLPVVFSTNCATGWFDNETDDPITGTAANSECFVEYWLRNFYGGAIGVFGSTRVSYSGYNDALAKGYFDAIWPQFLGYQTPGISDPVLTMGPVLNYAKLYMYSQYSSGSRIKVEFEEFHYFGDPATSLLTHVPQNFVVQTIDSCLLNQSDMTIFLNQQDAVVTLLQNKNIIASGISDVNGMAYLTFSPISSNTPLQLSITKPNFKPHLAKINVYPREGTCIICETQPFIDQDNNQEINIGEKINWKFNLKNTATFSAKNIQLQLTCSDTFITLLDSVTVIDSLISNETIIVTDLSFFVHNQCPADHDVSMQLSIDADPDFDLSVPLDFTVLQGAPKLIFSPSMIATRVNALNDSAAASVFVSNDGFGKLEIHIQDEAKSLIAIGDTVSNVWYNVPAGTGNIYHINQPVSLMRFSTFMQITSPIDIYFFVYEGDHHLGTYYKIGETSTHINQTGNHMFWSDYLDMTLQSGKYYYLGVSWLNGSAVISRSNEQVPVPIPFGTVITGGVNIGGTPPADSIYQNINQIYPFVQQIETGQGNWLNCSPVSAVLNPTDNMEIPVKFHATSDDTTFFTHLRLTTNDDFQDSVQIPVTLLVGSDSVHLIFYGGQIDDGDGNNNKKINVGEKIYIPLTIKNLGITDATNVVAKFILHDPNISIVDSAEVIGVLSAGQEISLSAFEFDVSPYCPTSHQFQYEILITADNNYQTNSTYDMIIFEGEPVITIQPDSLVGTITQLNDSLIIPVEITNDGYGQLIYHLENPVQKEMSIGSPASGAWLPFGDGVGNIYFQIIPTHLLELQYYFEADSGATIYFFVYEADSLIGNYHLLTANDVRIQKIDTCWISSGPLSCQLQSYKYYYIGASWSGNVQIGRMSETIPMALNTGMLLASSYNLGGSPPQSVIYRGTSAMVPVSQKFITGDGLWLDCPEDADTLFPRENKTIPVKFYATEPETTLFCNINIVNNDPQNQPLKISVSLTVSALANNIVNEGTPMPHSLSLHQNYPNPFNQSTLIQYELPKKSDIKISIYNILGQRIKSLIHKRHSPGYYKIRWNGVNNSGREVSSGLYFVVLETRNEALIKKILLVK